MEWRDRGSNILSQEQLIKVYRNDAYTCSVSSSWDTCKVISYWNMVLRLLDSKSLTLKKNLWKLATQTLAHTMSPKLCGWEESRAHIIRQPNSASSPVRQFLFNSKKAKAESYSLHCYFIAKHGLNLQSQLGMSGWINMPCACRGVLYSCKIYKGNRCDLTYSYDWIYCYKETSCSFLKEEPQGEMARSKTSCLNVSGGEKWRHASLSYVTVHIFLFKN